MKPIKCGFFSLNKHTHTHTQTHTYTYTKMHEQASMPPHTYKGIQFLLGPTNGN
jgi:hypothetical protein